MEEVVSVFGHLLTPQGAPMTGVEDQAQRGDRPARHKERGSGTKARAEATATERQNVLQRAARRQKNW